MDSTTPTKSPDSQNHSPPHHVQPINPLSFANEVLNNHHHHHHHLPQPPPPPPPPVVVIYKECLKNHAASIGGHALDGCGEFMPSSTTPISLKCDACGCHRNFHRREPDNSYISPTPISTNTPPTTHFINFQSRIFSPSPSPPPPPTYSTDHHRQPSPMTPTAGKGGNSRKRFRTKFTHNQKEKMIRFAEKLNWKMPRSEESVEEFCNEIGVSRGVLKVWMHNNKHTIGKNYSDNNNLNMNNNGTTNFGNISFQRNGYNDDVDKNNGGVHRHVSGNGSSSPSSS